MASPNRAPLSILSRLHGSAPAGTLQPECRTGDHGASRWRHRFYGPKRTTRALAHTVEAYAADLLQRPLVAIALVVLFAALLTLVIGAQAHHALAITLLPFMCGTCAEHGVVSDGEFSFELKHGELLVGEEYACEKHFEAYCRRELYDRLRDQKEDRMMAQALYEIAAEDFADQRRTLVAN